MKLVEAISLTGENVGRFLPNKIPACLSFRPPSVSRQQLRSPAMRLLSLLEDERKSCASWYVIFRQSP